ncbi:FeoA domain-containing protein [Vibrio tubiashii]|uniref:FeoA family protein n=1 Tax=Vibrio tubiashii TaxID=29498 RepID=UPI00234F9F71|nr:FeoA domain-containing protein [Vibrio tubiashii]WCP67463.1 FeoA domain-containing protein [Vibrio tubiashii]
METTLSQLPIKAHATITDHMSYGAIRQRLLDLGLIPQTKIEFVRKAPLGDPLEFRVGATSVVIRTTEADTVIVRLD